VGEIVCQSDRFDMECHLALRDVSVNDLKDPKFVAVRIKASNTDPFHKAVSVSLGRTGTHLCQVAAILGYMVQ